MDDKATPQETQESKDGEQAAEISNPENVRTGQWSDERRAKGMQDAQESK